MGTLLENKHYTAEPGPCSIFPNFTGVDSVDVLVLLVDNSSGGANAWSVGENIIGGTSNATGVLLGKLQTGPTAWTFTLGSVTGTFQNNEQVTGEDSGDTADADGTGTAATAPGGVTSTHGKGVLSIASDPDYTAAALGKGLFTITLKDMHAGLLNVKGCVVSSATADDYEFVVLSETVATTKIVRVQMFKGGAIAAPQSTEKVFFELVLATSSMKPLSY
jgi:hypothetical protein